MYIPPWFHVSALLTVIIAVSASVNHLPILDPNFTSGFKIINTGEKFSLNCFSPLEARWTYGGNKLSKKPSINPFETNNMSYPHGMDLIIKRTTYEHTGYYTCQVKDNMKMKMEMYLYVRDENNPMTRNKDYDIEGIIGDSVWIPCKPTDPHFITTLELREKDRNEIQRNNKPFDPKTGFLLQNLTKHDHETHYNCLVKSKKTTRTETFELKVIDKHTESDTPIIQIIDGQIENNGTHVFVGAGMNFTLACFKEFPVTTSFGLTWQSPNLHSQIVRDIEDANRRNYNVTSNSGNSTKNGRTSKDTSVQKDRETQTHVQNKTLSVVNTTKLDEGKYECILMKKYPKPIESSINIAVIDIITPVISGNKNRNNTNINLWMDNDYEIDCKANGSPEPDITWFKNGRILEASNRVSFQNNNQILIFKNVGKDTVGNYFCNASNQIGHDILAFKITVQEDKTILIVSLVAAFIILIIVIIILVSMARRIKKEREYRKELSFSWLKSFEDGAIDNINPDLGVEEQAELLPYDPIWEFERDRLKLGHQLGSGEFGVVMKGEAIGINDHESITTVAVKTIRKNAEASHVKALASELKIMSHLGKHLNVVNLLGACTKNLAKRELLVIVEYCKYGNLQGILLRHRHVFVNQLIDDEIHVTEKYKPDYLQNVVRPEVKYAPISWRKDQVCSEPLPENERSRIASTQSGSSSNYQWTSGNTDVSDFSDQSSEYTKMDSAVIFRNGKYETEDKSIQAIRTQDLLCWGFQIARGMDYLASRKVLHGDLAARNILLAADNVVKICDFGLARSVYKNENYYKTENIPLPVKWMAIESIQDHVFSIQSDIWSFGVVLWELFSLARSPYPGIPVDQTFIDKLNSGYRMEKPKYASTAVYEIMQECWQEEPGQRPPFSQLEEKLGDMLENSVKCLYIDKNTEYMVMNTMKEKQQEDYLTMMSAPTYFNEVVKQSASIQDPQEPQYVNLTADVAIEVLDESMDENVKENDKVNREENEDENIDDGYLSMSTALTTVNLVPDADSKTPVNSQHQNNMIYYQNNENIT